MTDQGHPVNPGTPQVRQRRLNISLVWLVPIAAALVGVSMLVHNALSAGPQITIDFQTAEGLEANKTQVKYKNVVIGQVTDINLADDRSKVTATVALNASASAFTSDDSQYWVVRPRIGAQGISGVDTLLSGSFIGADPGRAHGTRKAFTGLETPPPVTYGQQGRRFTLRTEDLGSLDIGSPVYYRRIQVGQVVSYHLAEDGKGIDVQIFVNAPNDKYVTDDSRFWNASGVDVSLGASGLKVNTQSMSAILSGGVAFVEPKYSPDAKPAEPLHTFTLFGDQVTALAPPDGEPKYIHMRFNQSLRGLNVNAPVEFHGVNFGHVVSVDLDYDEDGKTFPTLVGAVIYPARLGKAYERVLAQIGGEGDDERANKLMATFIKQGLRAQARSANLITGQLMISLDFMPNATPVNVNSAARPIEIPTVPGSLDKLQEQLQAMVDKISRLPLNEIGENLSGSLAQLNKTLAQVNGNTLPQLNQALAEAHKTLAAASQSLGEDSPQRQGVTDAMQDLQRTARSVRALTDFLGRHPEALIRGRTQQGQPDAYRSSPSTSRETDPE
ncbi:intermembrane transport protein PqiB [Pseudomonas typographi]|uniref:MCE family protein n=1 Tax=Pseudomonas typographi TaxID=2715964 RepID=A0ABR7Z8B4_9PSED|nr:MlaD family protein [Pseudomonas typographi]MBD1590051.1 MCE family protein [Pseudomonas typographi]MBD1601709.1 MCE family protein [Pseudomonas typographi]